MRLFSYGGGVQSFCALLLQINGKLTKPFDVFVFANVGEDSENPATLDHVKNVAIPLAAQHGIQFVEVRKLYKGVPDTVKAAALRGKGSVNIPVYSASGTPFMRRCTSDFKIREVERWIHLNGNEAEIGIGFSTDEAYRVNPTHAEWSQGERYKAVTKRKVYPLIECGMSRFDCIAYIEKSGYPVPPKSACYFCPFTTRGEWIERKHTGSPLWDKSVDFEAELNQQLDQSVYLHPSAQPLEQAVPDQLSLWDTYMDTDSNCKTGYCGL